MKNNQTYPHPLMQTMHELTSIFAEMGFEVASGPELEDVWHNFDALNVPKNHPARDMQDSFYIKGQEESVLRTHTSPVQVRFLENNQPPFKIVAPGKVFRNEATDATHEAQFYQIEGMVVGEKISLSHLKGTLEDFIKRFLGDDVEFRLRPGYFPFVEPGVEVDLKFNGKWLEVLGAGMVHPNVIKNCGYDPTIYSGFAFGMGIDRIMMMKYNIPDVRLSYTGDLRFHDGLTDNFTEK